MIKDDKVLVSINLRNAKKYRDLGYNIGILSISDKVLLEIPIDQISKTSKIKITAICDICGVENVLSINKYWRNFERGGYNFYSCFKCKNRKKEMTSLKIYGVKSFSQTDEFKEKFKETSLKNYGVDNPNKNKDVRDKIKKTNLDKYGVVTSLVSDENIEKSRKWMSSDEFKEKSKDSLIRTYGVDSYSKTEGFRKIIGSKKDLIVNKIKQSFLEKYGSDWYFQTEEFKLNSKLKIKDTEEKRKITCLEKYGVDNVSKYKDIYDKIYKTKIANGSIVSDENLTKWQAYKRNVNRVTNRFKKELYEKWDGSDYYDGEIIKGYLSHTHVHRFYPTIDHKISVLFGFINNIPIEEVGDISNLCITKRYINSMKNSLVENNFLLPGL